MGGVSIKLTSFPGMEESVFSFDIACETSLFDVVSEWGAQNAPDILRRVFDLQTGGVAGNMLIIQNGRSVKSDDPKTTMVSPGDAITIAPIIIGG